jgi:acrylyl-CoA reductase (NADPH)
VARISPLVPGIDLAGAVIASEVPDVPTGTQVLAHGYDLGIARHGGWAEYARVPAGWIVPLPAGIDPREAMALGTAGFTAALSVVRLEERGLTPNAGPILVTGASGGVGNAAIGILAERGYEVWAATGKRDEESRLRELGAVGFVSRDEYEEGANRSLGHEHWAAAIDTVGTASLPYVLRTLRYGAAVAATGNASGAAISTTVFPFILRGITLIGIDSAYLPIEFRREIWDRLATDLRPRQLGYGLEEVTLDSLVPAIDTMLAGGSRGRWIVRIGAGARALRPGADALGAGEGRPRPA